MSAFGPYKKEEIIDFTELGDNSLFVISGATGAGKTTVFDGICFALYGQASGEDRTDIRAMRSDFADDADQTSVELIFAIHTRRFRVMRQIPYLKKGNKTESTARVELYELLDDGEVPIVDRQIVSEINRKVEELIGFTQAQFSQIVMLPQGEFRKFLTSDTDNKETIMRKIFKTDAFRDLVDRLKVKKEVAQSELAIEERAVAGFIERISSLLPVRESFLFSTLATEYHNTNQVITGLNEEISYYTLKIVEDRKSYEASGKRHTELLTVFHEAKNVNERFNELDLKKQLLAAKTEQLPSMKNKEKQLADAERAVALVEVESQFNTLTEELSLKTTAYKKAQANLLEANENMATADSIYQQEDGEKSKREQLTEQLYKLNSFLPAVSDLSSRRNSIEHLKEQISIAVKNVEKTKSVTVEQSENADKLFQEEEILEVKVSSLDDKSDLLISLKEKLKVVKEFNAIRTEMNSLERDLVSKKEAYVNQKNSYEELEGKWLNNQAGVLAQRLQEGQACPVCGSMDHPTKTSSHTEMLFTREKLDAERARLTELESLFRSAEAKRAASIAMLTDKKMEIEQLQLSMDEEQLQTKTVELEKEVVELRRNKIELTTLKLDVKGQTKKLSDLVTLQTDQEKSIYTLQASCDKEIALVEQTIHEIPEEIRVLEILQKRIIETTAIKEGLEKAWASAQRMRELALEKLAKARSDESHAESTVKELTFKRENAQTKFTKALVESGFATIELYKQAKLTDEQRRLLENEIITFKQQYHTVQEAVKELGKLLETKQRIDLSVVETAVNEARQLYETKLSAYNLSLEHEKSAISLKEGIESTTNSKNEIEMKVRKVTDLYDVIRGQNEMKLSFERFIQIDYLERIIQSANERLRGMSNGQFELLRSDRQETRGKQSGLGIAVYDAYTGQNRDVKTLSGGEKFNASLCLALGMSDVIQSFQGSVSIETMFIDEGFGSLDEESLNRAVDTLIDLQKSGRMIGVISHVEELKAAFPALLEVTKSKEGHSSTSFSIK
jgi:exonuclease SbcC